MAVKCVRQSRFVEPLLPLMETFRRMVNDCIRIGLQNDASTMKRLSKLCYSELARYDIISYYKLHAISKAAGILANRKQSIKRMITYKATWEGVPVIQLTSGQTRGTSQLCPRCGKRLQGDRLHPRELYCPDCKKWMDRDVVAVMNIARKGGEVFHRS